MREYRTNRVAITDEPTLVCVVPQDIGAVVLRNVGDTTVYIGGPTVAPVEDDEHDMGLPIMPDDPPLAFPSYDSDSTEVYAVVESGGEGAVVYIVSS